MKAVNLIPAEERRDTGVAGRSGGGAYALLGALVVLVVLASLVGARRAQRQPTSARSSPTRRPRPRASQA